jgi:uncharacterized zinc-type alcohol dehydrogenase-like protein
MTTFHGWAARAAKSPLAPFAWDPGDLGPFEVEIAVEHCGICHSDLHLVDDDWRMSTFPFVPGHEIVGRVAAAGGAVTDLAAGTRVGVGWQRRACLACDLCLDRKDNLCAAQAATCVGHHGGFADRVRVDARYAFPLPGGLDAASAAPLLCGGATVYAPLARYRVGPSSSVGVIGIGGLGHLALRMLRPFGCEITAFSSTAGKRDEALAMGAHAFVPSNEPRELHRHAGRFDLILSTVAARLDWITYLETLRPGGTLCLLGAPPGILQIPAGALFKGQKALAASEIADRATIAEMLRFAARHGVAPTVEHAPLEAVNAAIDRLRRNEVRYRVVLDAPA